MTGTTRNTIDCYGKGVKTERCGKCEYVESCRYAHDDDVKTSEADARWMYASEYKDRRADADPEGEAQNKTTFEEWLSHVGMFLSLTPTQFAVLKMRCEGKSTREIGKKLGCSFQNVSAIGQKAGAIINERLTRDKMLNVFSDWFGANMFAKVNTAIHQLAKGSPRRKAIFWLRVQGLTVGQIAQELGTSKQVVSYQLRQFAKTSPTLAGLLKKRSLMTPENVTENTWKTEPDTPKNVEPLEAGAGHGASLKKGGASSLTPPIGSSCRFGRVGMFAPSGKTRAKS